MLWAAPFKTYKNKNMKQIKSQFKFKPLHSSEFEGITEQTVLKSLSSEQIEKLKKNKIFNTETGTFKMA